MGKTCDVFGGLDLAAKLRTHYGRQGSNPLPPAAHLKIKESIPLLCVTDHSSGHAEEWESLTPTRGATPGRGKTLPGALTYSPSPKFILTQGSPPSRPH